MEIQGFATSRRVGLSVFVSDPAVSGEWLAQVCGQIPGASGAILVLRVGAEGGYQVVAKWPDLALNEQALAALAERALGSMASQTLPIQSCGVRLALPVSDSRSPVGAVAVELRDCHDGGRHTLALLNLAVGWLLSAAALDREVEATREAAQLQQGVGLLAHVNRWEDPATAAMEICNVLAQQYECTRTAIGMLGPKGCALLAMSHSAWFDHRSGLVRALENAMDEALDQRQCICIPPLSGRKSGVTVAHRELGAGAAVLSVILAGTSNLGAGVLVLERDGSHPFTAGELSTLTRAAGIVGPVLEQKHEAYRWLGLRPRLLWRRFRERLRDPRRPALRVGLVCACLLFAALSLLPVSWRVTADAVIEGQQQRAIAAPFDGFIYAAHVKAGETVKKDQPLAELDKRTQELEYQRWAAEALQHERRFRDALMNRDRASAGVALAQQQEASAQRALAEEKLSKALLTAPFDAVVVSGDLSQQLGSPVSQGKLLFELAPLDSYRVFLKVDEQDIRAVRVGQSGHLVLAGLAEDSATFTVKNISVAEAHDGRNVFRVEAELQSAANKLRPGMNGVGKIDVGERSLIWIWTHKAWDWLSLTIWRWMP